MTRIATLLLFATAFLVACSSGGYSDEETESAALQGMVYEADGQTGDRSGIMLVLVETGDTATTDADGGFSFGDVPDGTYTVDLAGARLAAQSEGEMEDDEDGAGRPMVEITRNNGRVEIHLAIRDGKVVEWSLAHRKFQRATNRLDATDDAEGLEAKVRVESRDDRERLKICVEGLEPGDVIDVCLRAPGEATTFASVGTATADEEGEACFDRDTKQGDTLPDGARSVADLEGYLLQVKLGETVLFDGEIPPLPEPPTSDKPGNGNGNRPDFDGRAVGRAHLDSQVEGVEGDVHVRRWPAKDRQRMKVHAAGLTEGDEVTFQIEDPENAGTYIDLGTATANEEGHAKYDSHHGPLPVGATDVEELVGLGIRVLRGEDVILTGSVPELVAY